MAAWASAQQVIDATGVTVTQQKLAQAQDDIEIACGRTYADTSKLRTRDVYWLGKAVARQAAWVAGQFDLATRLDATATAQDGVSNTYTTDALVLAPMAARALRRCSWMRSRTVHVRSAIDGGGRAASALLEASDASQDWRVML